jgi:hypothetical protein
MQQGVRYWTKQFLLAAVSMFAIMVSVDLASGRNVADNVWISLAWALASAALFTGARYSQSRKR